MYIHTHSLYTSLRFCVSACAHTCMQTVCALCTRAEIFPAQSQHYGWCYYDRIMTWQHLYTIKWQSREREYTWKSSCIIYMYLLCDKWKWQTSMERVFNLLLFLHICPLLCVCGLWQWCYGSTFYLLLLHRHLFLPTSRTNAVLSVASTSNTGVAGRWLFRVDGTQVLLPGEKIN